MSKIDVIFNALADETRRQILMLLRKGSMNAGDIASHFNMTKPSISFHLNILKDAGLVGSRKEGQFVIYTLNVSVFEEATMYLMNIVKPEKK